MNELLITVDHERAKRILGKRIDRLQAYWRPKFEAIAEKHAANNAIAKHNDHVLMMANLYGERWKYYPPAFAKCGDLLAEFDWEIRKLEGLLSVAEMATGPYPITHFEARQLWILEQGRGDEDTRQKLEKETEFAESVIERLPDCEIPGSVKFVAEDELSAAVEKKHPKRPSIWDSIFGGV